MSRGVWVPEWVEPPALGINVEGNFSFGALKAVKAV